jgi:hypothetical protein
LKLLPVNLLYLVKIIMMEGSRHEKAAIVIASYAIGFVTAFILFTNVGVSSSVDTYVPSFESNSASVIGANTAPATLVAEAPPVTEVVSVMPEVDDSDELVVYKNGILEVRRSDGDRLLSFNPETSSIKVDLATMPQGYHYGDISYAVDAAGEYVFFCEKTAKDAETCSGYVYDIKADRINPVSKDGSPVPITLKSASETIWTALGLKIGTHYSESLTTPWIIVAN